MTDLRQERVTLSDPWVPRVGRASAGLPQLSSCHSNAPTVWPGQHSWPECSRPEATFNPYRAIETARLMDRETI